MAEENTEIGAVRQFPTKGDDLVQPLKKDIKAGLAVDPEAEGAKLSTETPDPNVDSLGDTTLPAGTTGTATTTVTTRSTT